MDLQDARVLITGASRGIGEAMAREFSTAGASVIACARSEDAIHALAEDIGGVAVRFDAADSDQVNGFVERVEADHGPIDVLINNAGVVTHQLIEDTPADEIERAIRINLITPEHLTAQMVPRMLDRGRGHLVYTSSVAATSGNPGQSVYCSTKGGLTRFAESIRMELKHTDIGVTILHLGPIETDMWDVFAQDPGQQRGIQRAMKLGMAAVAPADQVAKATLVAVQKNKREVRLPKRMAAGVSLNGAGTRSFEALLRGIDARVEYGKAPTQTAE